MPSRCRRVGATSPLEVGVRMAAPRLKSGPLASIVLRTVQGPMPPWLAPLPSCGPVFSLPLTRLYSVPCMPCRFFAEDHGKVNTMSGLRS